MIDLKELNKTIEYLNELKKKEESKVLEKLQETIKQEIISEIEKVLMHFESDKMVDFLEETKREVCFEYNGFKILEEIKDKLKVEVWEIK